MSGFAEKAYQFWLNAKVCGGNRSEKAIKELIDTDLLFPMLYGGKRKGLIAIPTRFCIEPLFRSGAVLSENRNGE